MKRKEKLKRWILDESSRGSREKLTWWREVLEVGWEESMRPQSRF